MTRARAWRLALLIAGVGAVFGGGWLMGARCVHPILTSTAFHPYAKSVVSTVAGYEFQAYGRFSTRGLVVRVYPKGEGESVHYRSLLVVSDRAEDAHPLGGYEVFHDRGLYLVSAGGRFIPFSVLHVVDQERILQVRVGDRIRVAGEYGEIEYHGGASCSLTDLGIFVCAVAELDVTHPAAAIR